MLITGVSGLTGKYILNHADRPSDIKIIGTSRRAHQHPDFETIEGMFGLDFANKEEYARLIAKFRPDVIANLGGDANVDSVEKNPDSSRVTNLDFPIFLMEQAEKVGARIVQFSSNAVYDGSKAPYSEASKANPLNLYGSFKAQVDDATRKFSGDWLILRPIVMYGWNYAFGRNNPVSQFVPMLQAGKTLRMVTDQFENPVYAGDVAAVFWKCVNEGIKGEFNLGGSDSKISRYDWLRAIAVEGGWNPDLVQPASISDFVLPAKRPRDTRFDITRLTTGLNYTPVSVIEGYRKMAEELNDQKIAA